MEIGHVSSLQVYPLKGARGVALERAHVRHAGLAHDRRLMLIDSAGAVMTQRSHPRLALVDVALDAETLTIAASGARATLALASASASASAKRPRRRVRVWDDDVDAIELPGHAAALLSDHLGERCTLVFMPDDVVRPVDPRYARAGDRVGFADGFPVLLASLASLADLNARLATPVPMNRFRPNVVVDGVEPWIEDAHARVRVGGLELRLPKRCARCGVVLVDQATAERSKEPLRTLATFRAEANKVYFAQNAVPDAEAFVAVGDPVVFLEPKRPG